MIQLLWLSATVLTAAFAIAFLLRRRSAATVHALWMAAFAALALLPVAPALLRDVVPPVAPLRFVIDAAASQSEAVATASAPAALGWIWFAGALLCAARLALGHARLAIAVRRSRPLDGIVREVDGACLPLTWGLFRPVVLMPAAARRWPAAMRDSVLRHELAHAARGDGWSLLFTHLLCCAYWFQPLVWLAARRARLAMERACDDRVLAAGGAPSDYAAHLLDVARVALDAPWPAAASVRPSDLGARIHAILDATADRRRAAWPIAALAAVALLLPAAALRAQDDEAVYKIGDGVTSPVVIHKVEPDYTEEARTAKVEGKVALKVVITKKGETSDIEIVRSLHKSLDEEAIVAIRKWRFRPATRDGKPVNAYAMIEVNFRLE